MDPQRLKDVFERLEALDDRLGHRLRARGGPSRGSLEQVEDRVRDLARFPELVWLECWYWVPPLALGLAIAAAGGLRLAVGGYLLGIVVLWHATFTINSLAHRWGTRPYPTGDSSRNNALLALLTFGEGWHNNHHAHPVSVRHGMAWYEIDLNWYGIWALQKLGLARHVYKLTVNNLPPRPVHEGAAVSTGPLLIHSPPVQAVREPLHPQIVSLALLKVAQAPAASEDDRHPGEPLEGVLADDDLTWRNSRPASDRKYCCRSV